MFGIGTHGAGAVPPSRAPRVGDWQPSIVTTYPYYDDFYGFGDVSISGRQPPLHPRNSGASWTLANSFVLASGHLEARFGAANAAMAWLDVGVTDATVRVEFEGTSGANKGVVSAVLRFADTSNYWVAQADFNNLNLKIISDVAGSFTLRATSNYSLVVDTRYAIKFVVSGNVFTATYYQVIAGVDTLITPSLGSNPQTFDATAVGSASGRLLHGIRAQSIVSANPVRIYKVEMEPTPLPVDATVTISGASTVTSRTIPAVSFVENPPVWNTSGWTAMKPNLAQAVGAAKIHIYPFGLLDPWPSNSSGKTVSTPTNLSLTGTAYLGQALAKIREMDANATIILTLYGAMWWMKETLFGGSVNNLTSASAYDDAGRVKNAALADWLILVDASVRLAAAAGCRDFEVWNELKGYYEVKPFVGQTWDATMNPGTTVQNPVMGYAYFYQQTANQIVTTMTALGIASNAYRVGGPYMLLLSDGVADSNSVAPGHALRTYGSTWGYAQKAPIGALTTFLGHVQAQSMRLDTLLLDTSTVNVDEVYAVTDPFALTKKYEDYTVYIRSLMATYGLASDIPIDYSEIYAVPQPALRTTDAALRTALVADMLVWCILNRVRYPIVWGPTAAGTGGTGGSLGGLVATNGAMQGPGNVAKFVKANFAPGTAVYTISSDTGNLGGLATASKLLVYNKTNADVTVDVAGTVMDFTSYETKLLTR